MKNSTVVKPAGALTSLAAGLQAKKGELVQTADFTAAVELAGSLQRDLDDFWKAINDFMVANKIKTVKGDWGHATVATRKNYMAAEQLPPRFYKKVLDTQKVTAHQTMHGSLPTGVTVRETKYLSKKVNL